MKISRKLAPIGFVSAVEFHKTVAAVLLGWSSRTPHFIYSISLSQQLGFSLKLFELFKTRSKKSSPSMLNFFVISAGHDIITDAGNTTNCKQNFKAA